jgi:hypothetical protein
VVRSITTTEDSRQGEPGEHQAGGRGEEEQRHLNRMRYCLPMLYCTQLQKTRPMLAERWGGLLRMSLCALGACYIVTFKPVPVK